jgi:hypothetical protein
MLREIAVDEEGGKNDVEISRYIKHVEISRNQKINISNSRGSLYGASV